MTLALLSSSLRFNGGDCCNGEAEGVASDASNGFTINITSVDGSAVTCNTTYDIQVWAVDLSGAQSGGPDISVTTAPCSTGGKISQVVWIIEENEGYSQVVGSSSAPYINNTLIADYGLAEKYYGFGHFSADNYVEMTSGQGSCGFDATSNQSCFQDAEYQSSLSYPSIFGQLPSGASQTLAEGMAGKCEYGDNSANEYAQRHNPMTYYADSLTECNSSDVPLSGTLASAVGNTVPFTMIIPNLCDDGHTSCAPDNNQVKQQDDWLSSNLPSVLSSSQFTSGSMVIFITWDEDTGTTPGPTTQPSNHVPLLILDHNETAGTTDTTTTFTHDSLLKSTMQLLGGPLSAFPSNIQTAPSLVGDGFGF